MVEKLTNENVRKKDLELILEVNKKAIEIQSEVVEQNEEIIDSLSSIKTTVADVKKTQADQDKVLDEIVDQADEIKKDLFKMQILFITGLLSLVVQIIQIFLKK